MRKVLKIIIASLVFISFMSSCKYEEGPAISFYQKETRLTGYYVFDKVEINGVDVTEDYSLHTIQFSSNNEIVWNQDVSQDVATTDIMEVGTWEFKSNKEKLLTKFNTRDKDPFEYLWDIQKLKYHDMKLEYNKNDSLIIWELHKFR